MQTSCLWKLIWIDMWAQIQCELVSVYLLIWGPNHRAECSGVSGPDGRYFAHGGTGGRRLCLVFKRGVEKNRLLSIETILKWPQLCHISLELLVKLTTYTHILSNPAVNRWNRAMKIEYRPAWVQPGCWWWASPICCRKRRATLSGNRRRLRMKRDRSPPEHHSKIR